MVNHDRTDTRKAPEVPMFCINRAYCCSSSSSFLLVHENGRTRVAYAVVNDKSGRVEDAGVVRPEPCGTQA